jgi:hypothetical protein
MRNGRGEAGQKRPPCCLPLDRQLKKTKTKNKNKKQKTKTKNIFLILDSLVPDLSLIFDL